MDESQKGWSDILIQTKVVGIIECKQVYGRKWRQEQMSVGDRDCRRRLVREWEGGVGLIVFSLSESECSVDSRIYLQQNRDSRGGEYREYR